MYHTRKMNHESQSNYDLFGWERITQSQNVNSVQEGLVFWAGNRDANYLQSCGLGCGSAGSYVVFLIISIYLFLINALVIYDIVSVCQGQILILLSKNTLLQDNWCSRTRSCVYVTVIHVWLCFHVKNQGLAFWISAGMMAYDWLHCNKSQFLDIFMFARTCLEVMKCTHMIHISTSAITKWRSGPFVVTCRYDKGKWYKMKRSNELCL